MREIRREEGRAEGRVKVKKTEARMERVLGASANSTRAAAIRIRTILFVKGNPAQNQTTSEPVNALIRAGNESWRVWSEDQKAVSNFKARVCVKIEGKSIAGDAFFQRRTCETAAAICNLQKSERRFCRSVNGRANWKTSVRRLPVTGARSARLRSLPFCRPTADFSLRAFRLTSPRPPFLSF